MDLSCALCISACLKVRMFAWILSPSLGLPVTGSPSSNRGIGAVQRFTNWTVALGAKQKESIWIGKRATYDLSAKAPIAFISYTNSVQCIMPLTQRSSRVLNVSLQTRHPVAWCWALMLTYVYACLQIFVLTCRRSICNISFLR